MEQEKPEINEINEKPEDIDSIESSLVGGLKESVVEIFQINWSKRFLVESKFKPLLLIIISFLIIGYCIPALPLISKGVITPVNIFCVILAVVFSFLSIVFLFSFLSIRAKTNGKQKFYIQIVKSELDCILRVYKGTIQTMDLLTIDSFKMESDMIILKTINEGLEDETIIDLKYMSFEDCNRLTRYLIESNIIFEN